MNKKITCRPWNVVDRIKHNHPRNHEAEHYLREFYVTMHDRLKEGAELLVELEGRPMILVRRGKNFVIDRIDINIRDYTNA